MMNRVLHSLHKILTVLFVFITFPGLSQSHEPPYEQTIRHQQLQYIAAGDSIQQFDQARAYFLEGKYSTNKHGDLNLGIAKDDYWVTFQVSNPTPAKKEFYINLENPRLNDVTVYILSNNAVKTTYRFGDYFPYTARPVYENFFAFPLQFDSTETQRIFLFIRHKGNTLQVPISMVDRNRFLQSIESNYIVTGITTGVLFLTFFFALFFYFQSKNKLFVFYAIYAFCLWGWLWSTEAFGFQYIYSNLPSWANRIGPGSSVIAIVFFIACCLEFCKPYDNKSRASKILRVLMYLLAGWGILPFLPFINISKAGSMSLFLSVHFLLNVGTIFFLVAYLLWVSFARNKLVWFYFSAVIISLSCSLALVARHSGWIDLPVTSGTFMSIGVVIELIVMTAGITRQFYMYKEEKEAMLVEYLRQQKAINEKILLTEEAERKRIARELHDDIGAGLTRVTLMSEIAKSKTNISAKELEDIAIACRGLVSNMGEIVWSLNPENNSLAQLIGYMREELNKLLEYSGIDYNIELPVDTNAVRLSNEQRRNILLVTKEAVNNAVKYSKAKNIGVQASLVDSLLSFKIEDDGIGYNEVTRKAGNGIRNIKQRIEEMNGDLSIKSEEGKGTTIQFSVKTG